MLKQAAASAVGSALRISTLVQVQRQREAARTSENRETSREADVELQHAAEV